MRRRWRRPSLLCASVPLLLLALPAARAYFRMEETDCYSCASQEYKAVWERKFKAHKPISAYLNRPRKFSTLCSNPDAFRTFAAVTKCNFTCLSILEPTVAGESLFKVPQSFQVLHELGLLALRSTDEPRCAKVEIQDLYGSSKLPEFLELQYFPDTIGASVRKGAERGKWAVVCQVCACKWNQCNTHPQRPQNVNAASALSALLPLPLLHLLLSLPSQLFCLS